MLLRHKMYLRNSFFSLCYLETKCIPVTYRIEPKFHAIKHANEAVDKVRKAEAKQNAMLKNSKYLWLKNEANLTESRRAKKETLQKKHLKTARAYAMRVEYVLCNCPY